MYLIVLNYKLVLHASLALHVPYNLFIDQLLYGWCSAVNKLLLYLLMEVGQQANNNQACHKDATEIDGNAGINDPASSNPALSIQTGVVHSPITCSTRVLLLSKH